MLGQQFATILGQTDPFDVAQGLERHIREMPGAEIRTLIETAAPRMNEWYRSEFLPLAAEDDDHSLRTSFAHSLKSNLRAIPLFGPAFCEGVIAHIPGDRTVGLGEEGRNWRVRPVAFAIIALALVIAGAAAEHVFSTARANANTPVVLTTPEPVKASPAAALKPKAAPAPLTVRQTAQTRVTPRTPAPTPARAIAQAPPAAAAASAPAPAVLPAPPVQRTATAAPRRKSTPPAGSGVKTVIAQEPKPVPTAEATPVDTSDMPQAYTDATPLPANAPPPAAEVNTAALRVPTPTPAPNRSWTHRLVHAAVHLVNSTLTTVGVSKKPSQPTPSASPPGPHQR